MKNLFHSHNNILLLKNSKILFTLVFLAGCSTVPAAINPVEWFKGARDAIIESDAEKEEKNPTSPRKALVTKSNDGFAKLSSVPDRPKILSGDERKIISGGLIGDHDAARKYSSETFTRQNNAKISSLGKEQDAGPTVIASPTLKFLKSGKAVEPLFQPKPKLKTANAYLVPPKPVELGSVQDRTKLRIKTRKRLLPSKTAVSVKAKINKLPKINPNPPKIGNVPSFGENFQDNQTVVISGSGVQQMSFSGTFDRKPYRVPPSSSDISKVTSSGQLGQYKNQESYQVATILFPNGSARVEKDDRRVLRQVIAQHRKVGGTLRIVGHASGRSETNDPVIHKMVNFEVSAARAERVANELVKMGVKANKLLVRSVSDREPRYYEYMPSGEAGNRRAEIFIDFL